MKLMKLIKNLDFLAIAAFSSMTGGLTFLLIFMFELLTKC